MPAIEFPPQLSDETVLVRQIVETDAPAYAAAFAHDPELSRLLGMPQDPDEQWVRGAAGRVVEAARAGSWLELVVCRPAEERLIGAIGLTDFSWRHRRCELGYWMAAPARGQGLAPAACRLVVSWLFEALELLRIEIATTAENLPSQRVAQRLGFTAEARQRERDLERGRRVDVIRYGLLREEWPA